MAAKTLTYQPLGSGAQYAIDEGMFHISFPVTAEAIAAAPLSKKGENKLVATTHGFTGKMGPVRVSLNVIADK